MCEESILSERVFRKNLMTLQPSQPLSGILSFRNTRISVLPDGEEFLVMLYGFSLPVILEVFS
jgi:hypothetical protein